MWRQPAAAQVARAAERWHRQLGGANHLQDVHHEATVRRRAAPDEILLLQVDQLHQARNKLPPAVEAGVQREARGIVARAGTGDIRMLLHQGITGQKRARSGEAHHRLRGIHPPRRLHHLQVPLQPHQLQHQAPMGAVGAAEAVDQHAMDGTKRNLRRM